jgi:hypothetical protein
LAVDPLWRDATGNPYIPYTIDSNLSTNWRFDSNINPLTPTDPLFRTSFGYRNSHDIFFVATKLRSWSSTKDSWWFTSLWKSRFRMGNLVHMRMSKQFQYPRFFYRKIVLVTKSRMFRFDSSHRHSTIDAILAGQHLHTNGRKRCARARKPPRILSRSIRRMLQ